MGQFLNDLREIECNKKPERNQEILQEGIKNKNFFRKKSRIKNFFKKGSRTKNFFQEKSENLLNEFLEIQHFFNVQNFFSRLMLHNFSSSSFSSNDARLFLFSPKWCTFFFLSLFFKKHVTQHQEFKERSNLGIFNPRN